MAGPIDWNHWLMLLLLTTTCAQLTSSDTSACLSEILENTTVDIKPAITNGATGSDPVHVSTEANCLKECCLANSASGDLNCTFVIFDSRKAGKHPNCYLFHCPTNDACPTKPSAGVTSHRLMRDKALPGNSHSKIGDSKPTYVDGNKKNGIFLDSHVPEPQKQAEPLATGGSMNKSITSKILVLAEDIEKRLDKIDQSLKEEKGQEEEKKDSKPQSYQKPDIFVQLATTAAATKIMTTTQATTSTTTTTLTTTTTTLPMTTTTLSPTTTTTIPATTPKPTTPPKPMATLKPTTTTTPLPRTTTTPLPTTTTLPTTTSTVTTTLPITTPKITFLPTTTSTTWTTTTSTTTRLTTISTTTPVKTTTKHPLVKLRPANSHLSKTTSNKVISFTTTAESRVPSPDVRPQAPLPKTQNFTAGGASKINVSSPITPFVGVDSVTSSLNFNQGLNGYEKKLSEEIPNPDSKTSDRSGLLAALVFGVIFFAVVVVLITRRALEAMRRRHYSRLDYLINGMYIDS